MRQSDRKRETPRCLATTRRPARAKASFSRLKNNALVLLTQQDGFVNTFSDAGEALFLALRREMPTFVGTGGKMAADGKKTGHKLPTTAVFAYLYTLERQ